MKNIKRTAAIIAGAFGLLFLFTAIDGTDIQLGFGVTLLVIACMGWE